MSDVDVRATKAKAPVWKAFLNPGWVFTAILIIAFTYFAFTALAPWQLHKNTALTERNHLIEQAFESDPAPYSEVFNEDGTLPADHEYQRVELRGHYLPDSEVIMRVRPVDNGPAYHALTPFQLDDGRTVLINRGWQRPADGKIPDTMTKAPTGEVSIIGYARESEPRPHNAAIMDQGRLQVSGINPDEVAEITHTPMGHDFVQLASDQPGVLTPFPLPTLETGPHLSYGIQWIAFGIMAPIGLGYFVWAEIRERRRVEDEVAEMTTSETAAAAGPPDATQRTDRPDRPEKQARQRSRYGDKAADSQRWARRDEERF